MSSPDIPSLKVKLWMSDRPSNQWLYSESPTEKSPGPFLRRVPCSQDGMEPTGQRSQAWHSVFYRYIKIMFVPDKDHDFISQDSVTPFAKERFSYLYMERTHRSKHLDKIKILCRALLSRWSCEISMKTSSRQEKVWILPVTAMEYNQLSCNYQNSFTGWTNFFFLLKWQID